jgi:hypothetical protein
VTRADRWRDGLCMSRVCGCDVIGRVYQDSTDAGGSGGWWLASEGGGCSDLCLGGSDVVAARVESLLRTWYDSEGLCEWVDGVHSGWWCRGRRQARRVMVDVVASALGVDW